MNPKNRRCGSQGLRENPLMLRLGTFAQDLQIARFICPTQLVGTVDSANWCPAACANSGQGWALFSQSHLALCS